jgi:hypothetical protein
VTRTRPWGPLLLGLVASLGCATATNYTEPNRPRYAGAHAEETRPAASPDGALRVVTFNIEYAKRIDAALEALRSHPELRGADVIALQEMDAPGVERIARALALN